MRVLTYEEKVAAFGDPIPHVRDDGTVAATWERAILGWCVLPAPLPLSWVPEKTVTRFKCHRLLVTAFEAALVRIYERKDAWRTIGDFGGCYNWRMQRGSRTALSSHAWGAAIDLDVTDNPQGAEPKVHPWVLSSFSMFGFYWGGNFKGKRKDGMHFEVSDEMIL